ncbi:hypothetical protein DSO57_1027939 [Entomophthora muscae]|uniref:Uncharacterized protein n=1 Tax=Entomophthora muscae TaxID=34485 RepID=A0ACC2T1N1_9FUNG|nr:hypothetical protein DSO57_1027939 [Entomophthora muscae]
MKVFATTLNCYKTQFYHNTTFDWLSENLTSSLKRDPNHLPDLIAIAFQEFLPLDKAFGYGDEEYETSIGNMLLKAIDQGMQDFFTQSLLERGSKKTAKKMKAITFKLVKMTRHVGNALFIFSHQNLIPSEISVDRLGLGWFWLGNKGAVAIRLVFEGENRDGKALKWTVCFLSCHLRRKQDRFTSKKSSISRTCFQN